MSQTRAYLDQDYETLKSECRNSGQLFVDDQFPADDSSIFRFKNFIGSKIVWKRPHEIVKDPKFIINKIEPNDLDQGKLGNCWMLAAAACVLNSPNLIERTIPLNQSFDESDYAGIFHFKFWVNGEWVDVVVDDFLPVYEDKNKLCFCKNFVEKNEMYGPLLEKAYAKLNICYEFLILGYPHDALVDLTGGINETYSLKTCRLQEDEEKFLEPSILWEIIYKAKCYKSLYTCTKSVDKDQELHGKLPNGLVLGHVYSIMGIFEIIEKDGSFDCLREIGSNKPTENSIKLLKIRNPWGKKNAYLGPWSKDTEEWNQVGNEAKELLEHDNQDDGQFFMSFEDFIQEFDFLSICHVNVNGLNSEEFDGDLHWKMVMYKGEWIVGENAGGCKKHEEFWTNPQHKITFEDLKEKISIVVSLSQEGFVKKRFDTKGRHKGIHESLGFYLFSINEDAEPDQNGLYDKDQLKLVKYTKTFQRRKETSMRIEISPGDYVIIPCCFDKDKPGEYVLRIYMESKKINNDESETNIILDEEIDPQVDDSEKYDRLFYQGMNDEEIESLNKQIEENTSRACVVM